MDTMEGWQEAEAIRLHSEGITLTTKESQDNITHWWTGGADFPAYSIAASEIFALLQVATEDGVSGIYTKGRGGMQRHADIRDHFIYVRKEYGTFDGDTDQIEISKLYVQTPSPGTLRIHVDAAWSAYSPEEREPFSVEVLYHGHYTVLFPAEVETDVFEM